MARVKRGVAAHKRHKKVLAQVKGHYSTNNRLYKRAHEQSAATDAELIAEVRRTILHEVGHHFGMEEEDLPY